MEQTWCYSYFGICSQGEILSGRGLVSEPKDGFDPAYITEKLGIKPFRTTKMGETRRGGGSVYGFSSWSACRQEEPAADAAAQCLKIVRELKCKIPLLLELRRNFNLEYHISIVPHIFWGETPAVYFTREVIEFCYLTGTEIGVDMYIYGFEEENF